MEIATVERHRPDVEGRIQLRAGAAFRDWLAEFARSREATVTDTVVQGVVALAKAEGFEPVAPER